jgi:hypothetical protein
MKIELNLQNKKLELIQWLSTEEGKDWWNSIAESEKRSH